MTGGAAGDLLRAGIDAAAFARGPVRLAAADASVRERVASRAERFLAAADTMIWSAPAGPVRRLLDWAGCERGDLAGAVRRDGLEPALASLSRAGVRFDARELAGRTTLRRGAFTLETRPEDFANPALARRSLQAATSGTSGSRRPAPYAFALFADEAPAERLLLAANELDDAPLALWYPGPPGIAGLHNLLVHRKLGRAPERWFSQVPPPRWREAPRLRLALEGLAAFGLVGRWPRPRHTPLGRAVDVARWLAEGRARGERRGLKAFTSAAVRMASAAADAGLDVSGQVVFAGGEPLTAERHRRLAGAGLNVRARYAATEAGFVAGGCGRGTAFDAMHVYLDRLALLVDGAAPPASAVDAARAGTLSFTALAASSPLVLLNAELGDHATLRRVSCSCALGQAGFDLEVSAVSSPEKVAGEGIKLPAAAVAEAAANEAARCGGAADDVQVSWHEDAEGRARLTVAVSPRLSIDEEAFGRAVLARLRGLPGGPLAERLWSEVRTLRVVRREPRPTGGQKLASVIADESRDDDGHDG